MEKLYSVREAVEMTGVKSHVLRYWEEEMELQIARNELGHRYYTANDIQLFLNVKELKARGLQLIAIKELIPQIARKAPGSTGSKVKLLKGEVLERKDTEEVLFETCAEAENESEKKKILEFDKILERLIRQELELKKSGEHRYRTLDQSIRERQLARREAAAAAAPKKGHKKILLTENS